MNSLENVEELQYSKSSLFNGENKRLFLRALYLSINIRIGLFFICYVIGRSIPKIDTPIMNFIYQVLARWDAVPFLFIAEHGYVNYGAERNYLAYFPLYPSLVNIFSYISGTYMASALIVSFICSVFSGFFLQKLVMKDSSENEAKKTLWFFYFFPTAYFLTIPYSESLFICLVLTSLFFAREKKWLSASLLAMLVCATRLQGLVMLPTLMIEFWMQRKEIKLKNALFLGLIPLGFIAYLFINFYIAGDFFEFLTIQRVHFFHQNILPTTSIWSTLKHIIYDVPSEIRTTIYEAKMVAIIFAAALLIYSSKWMRLSYQFFSWSQLIVLLTDSWIMSMPRYLLAIFPLFIILARLAKNEERYQLMISLSTMMMAGLFALYSAGNWAF